MAEHALKLVEPIRAPLPLKERLIVALDVPTIADARNLVEELGDDVVFYKIGMQLQFAGGLDFAKELIDQGKKVFLDSKLLDIEQTVTSAVESVARLGVSFLTVHGNGPTIQAAVKGRGASDLKVFSVTVLTSLDANDMHDLGLSCTVEELVMQRAKKAMEAGADGVIASGEEAGDIRALAGEKLMIITPGIRPKGVPAHDQKRVVTPTEAIKAGADYLVVGRAITGEEDPRQAALDIFDEIEEAL